LHGLQGLQPAAAQGLQGLQPAGAQGLHLAAAQGLHFAAAQGLLLAAAQGLHGLGFLTAQGLHAARAGGARTCVPTTASPAATPARTTSGIIVVERSLLLLDCIGCLPMDLEPKQTVSRFR